MARDQIGVVFEEAENLYGYMTAEKNIRYFSLLNGLRGRALRERAEEVLEELELMEKRQVLVQ